MKKLLIFTIIFLIASSGVFGQSKKVPDNIVRAFREARIPVVSEGIEPFDFTLPLLDGTNITLSQLKGKVVFLNFWATCCGPCRSEMPSMEAFYQRLKNSGLEILTNPGIAEKR